MLEKLGNLVWKRKEMLAFLYLCIIYARVRPIYVDELAYIHMLFPCFEWDRFCNFAISPEPIITQDVGRALRSLHIGAWFSKISPFKYSLISSISLTWILFAIRKDEKSGNQVNYRFFAFACLGTVPWVMTIFRPESLLINEVALLLLAEVILSRRRLKWLSQAAILAIFIFTVDLSYQCLLFNILLGLKLALSFPIEITRKIKTHSSHIWSYTYPRLGVRIRHVRGIVIMVCSSAVLFQQLRATKTFLPLSDYKSSILENIWNFNFGPQLEIIIAILTAFFYLWVCIKSFLSIAVIGWREWNFKNIATGKWYIMTAWIISSYSILLADPFLTFYRVDQSYLASLAVICISEVLRGVDHNSKRNRPRKLMYLILLFCVSTLNLIVLQAFATRSISKKAELNYDFEEQWISDGKESSISLNATCKKKVESFDYKQPIIYTDKPILMKSWLGTPAKKSIFTGNLWYVRDRLILKGLSTSRNRLEEEYKVDCSRKYNLSTTSIRKKFIRDLLEENNSNLTIPVESADE